MFPRPRDLLLLLAAICCGMGLLAHATHADEFEKARAAELAERREGEQRKHLSGTRARFFRYTEIDSKGDDHYPASAFADDILSGKVRQATDRDPIAEWFYRTLLGLKPLRDEVPFAALTQGPDSLPRSYRKSAPYYILARTYELQLGRTNMNGKSGGKSVFHVSTDHPGYWYFVKGLKKASFHGGTREDGVDYLLKALSIAATGKKALASSWLKDTSAFYATDYRFSPERKKKLPVWSGDLGFRKVEKFWGPDYYVRRGRKYGYNEVVAAINEANAARKKYNARLKQKNEAVILGQIGPIRTKMDDITRSIVTSLSGSSFKNRELVEASLIVLSDYHRRCWRGDLVRRLEDHIDPDRIKPQLYLFSRIHSELEKSGKLDGYFFADSGFLYRPTAAWHIGCGSR